MPAPVVPDLAATTDAQTAALAEARLVVALGTGEGNKALADGRCCVALHVLLAAHDAR